MIKICVRGVVAAVLTTAAMVWAFAAPASAGEGTYTVSAGIAAPGRVAAFIATTGPFTFDSYHNIVSLSCAAVSMQLNAKVAAHEQPPLLVRIPGSETQFSGCTLAGSNTPVTVVGDGLWALSGDLPSSTSPLLLLAHVSLTVAAVDGSCTFQLQGGNLLTYHNTSQTLVDQPNLYLLRVSNVQGCTSGERGVVDRHAWHMANVTFDVAAKISHRFGPLQITSP